MITRRHLLNVLGAGALVVPSIGFSQRPNKILRVGFLSARRRPVSLDSDYYGAFPKRLSELGYVEGKNLTIEWRFAEGDYARLPTMAEELVRLGVSIILALGPPGVSAARNATSRIPIVMVTSTDPVEAGFVKSLARPGGNITGLVNLAVDLSPKHLEMLWETVPELRRVAVLVNPDNEAHASMLQRLQNVAQKFNIAVLPVRARTVAEIEKAFAAMARDHSMAVIVALDPLFIQQGAQIAAQALKYRLASIFANREYAEAGGLMSYGQDQVEIYRRVAEYADRIFKGARAADLPVEQPTKLELIINGRTAKALGLSIPQSLRISAANVIE